MSLFKCSTCEWTGKEEDRLKKPLEVYGKPVSIITICPKCSGEGYRIVADVPKSSADEPLERRVGMNPNFAAPYDRRKVE